MEERRGMTDDTLHPGMFPEAFRDVAHLEDFMSTPTAEVVADLAALEGDIIILGVAGKIGVTLARMAKAARACALTRHDIDAQAEVLARLFAQRPRTQPD